MDNKEIEKWIEDFNKKLTDLELKVKNIIDKSISSSMEERPINGRCGSNPPDVNFSAGS